MQCPFSSSMQCVVLDKESRRHANWHSKGCFTQEGHLVLGRDEEVLLAQRVHCAVLCIHLNLDRVVQAGALQLGHLAGHGGREQLRSPLLWHDLRAGPTTIRCCLPLQHVDCKVKT